MAILRQLPKIECSVSLTLSESEMRAFDALVGYGEESFLKVFYDKLGRAYLGPHEAGLRTLFKAVRDQLPNILHRVTEARKVFEQDYVAVPKDRSTA